MDYPDTLLTIQTHIKEDGLGGEISRRSLSKNNFGVLMIGKRLNLWWKVSITSSKFSSNSTRHQCILFGLCSLCFTSVWII